MRRVFLITLFLSLIISLSIADQSIAKNIVSVEVDNLHFDLPAYLTNPANSASISCGLIFSYDDKQVLVMNEMKFSDYPMEHDKFMEIFEGGIKKMPLDNGLNIAQSLGQTIVGSPSILVISYDIYKNKYNGAIYQHMLFVLKIKLAEGFIIFSTWRNDPLRADMEQFIEEKKILFINWVKMFMSNYKWTGSQNVHHDDVGYRSQYGLIQNKYLSSLVKFEVNANYIGNNISATLTISSSNLVRYRILWMYDAFFTLIHAWLAGDRDKYYFKFIQRRQIMGRNGLEMVFVVDYGELFYWIELPNAGDNNSTAFDISGVIIVRSASSNSEFAEEESEPVAFWNQFVGTL
jgi:hypothetical protein